jgi:amino-acid N-acetyltransferase
MATLTISPLDPTELPHLADLLVRCGLPTAGLEDHLATLLVARAGAHLVGSIGLEIYNRAALLRSVAVDEAWRSRGVGQRLVDAALDLAQRHAVDELYLLTETAAPYFARRGFVPIGREEVAPAVTASVEFTSACPASAQAMRQVLVAGEPA